MATDVSTIRKHGVLIAKVRSEVSKAVIGQGAVVTGMLRSLLCNGHVLLEGVPGVAKTLLSVSLSTAFSCRSNRIQFTPDLLPSDIVGFTTYHPGKGMSVVQGPVFTNFLLADEINRAPPKVQSALLEAMQERKATIGKQTYPLESPFFVMATENPIESLGTYPLPHAQVDRFLFKLIMTYPEEDEEKKVLDANISTSDFSSFGVKAVAGRQDLLAMQAAVKGLYADDAIKAYIVRLVSATRQPSRFGVRSGKYIAYGASPRAGIGLYIASKADAFLSGQPHVTPQHVKNVAYDALRHRILLNYEGQAENVTTDQVIDELLSRVPVK